MYEVQMKRVYEEAAAEDGRRILVDRLWPRGMKKERAALAEWAKEVTPSHAHGLERGIAWREIRMSSRGRQRSCEQQRS